jgi:hypothetical protein
MTGLSSTARRRRRCGHGCFSRPDSGNAKEDRGSSSGNGDSGTPNDRGSQEECNNGSVLPVTAVNPLGWWNDVTATDDNSNNRGIVKELLSLQQREHRGGQGQRQWRRQRRDPQRPREQRKMQQWKGVSRNNGQSAGVVEQCNNNG